MLTSVPNNADAGGPGMDHALSDASLESDNRQQAPCLQAGPSLHCTSCLYPAAL